MLRILISTQQPDVIYIRFFMMVYNHIDIRFKPVLYLVMTFQMITLQNVVSKGNNQFLTCSMALVSLIGLIDVFKGLFIHMHHGTKLLIQSNSFRFKTVCSILCQAQPIITRHWCFVPEHQFIWLKPCWCMRSGIVSIHQRRHISWPIWFLLLC